MKNAFASILLIAIATTSMAKANDSLPPSSTNTSQMAGGVQTHTDYYYPAATVPSVEVDSYVNTPGGPIGLTNGNISIDGQAAQLLFQFLPPQTASLPTPGGMIFPLSKMEMRSGTNYQCTMNATSGTAVYMCEFYIADVTTGTMMNVKTGK